MSDKPKKPITEIYLRSYPKIIFFWPLLLTSFGLWIAQIVMNILNAPNPAPIAWFGNFWFIMFFINLFITAFDFSSTKFFVLILIGVVVILLIIFLVIPNVAFELTAFEFNPGLTAEFYLLMTIILALILGIVVLSAQFDYWKIERNEIYHKAGIFTSAERIPTKSLRLKKEIPDVFEFFILRAGTIVLSPGHGDVIPLTTVLNINKKQEQIDYLLSHISTEADELDNV